MTKTKQNLEGRQRKTRTPEILGSSPFSETSPEDSRACMTSQNRCSIFQDKNLCPIVKKFKRTHES